MDIGEVYFKDVLGIGNLYLEKVFNKFEDENIIFICRDVNQNTYLSLCYEFRNSLRWVISKISTTTIIKIILKTIDLRTALEMSPDSYYTHIVYKDNIEKSDKIQKNNFSEQYLPQNGVYLKPTYDLKSYIYSLSLEIPTNSKTYGGLIKYTLYNNSCSLNKNISVRDLSDGIKFGYDLSLQQHYNSKETSFITIDGAA